MQSNNFKLGIINSPLIVNLYNDTTSFISQVTPPPPPGDIRVTNAFDTRITNVTSDIRITNT